MTDRAARLCSLLLMVACGGVDGPALPDAGAPDALDALAPDAAAAPAPYIGDVLDCGRPALAGGLTAGADLQRVDLDPIAFPGALCNDGTRGFFYVRPATSVAARDRWVIQLQGGGACTTPDSCARRWCRVDTNFGETQMTATLSPAGGIVADGILQQGGAGGEPNPLGDANHVFVRYCSSDSWAGTAGAIDVDAVHPITAAPVRFRIAFAGAAILDAVVATLRRDGAAPPAYTLGGGSTTLPDLDDAVAVTFAGASAGGAGVAHQADRLRADLRAHNTACGGAACPLQFLALIDSAFGPSSEHLDFSTSTLCADAGLCTHPEVYAAFADTLAGRRSDASCPTWHAANDPATAWRCDDLGHVIREHLTAPFMVRMGLTDELLSSNLIDLGVSAGGSPLTLQRYAELVRADLLALPAATPEEPFAAPPAVFGPRCAKHETISSNPAVYATTLTSGGVPYTMFDVLTAFVTRTQPQALVWNLGDPVVCP